MTRMRKSHGERGAVLIHVAIALIALLAFTSFVIDYGVMWVSRRQAQNAADAAALAGAVAQSIEGKPYEIVNRSAQQVAASNPIWGQFNTAANVTVTLSGPPSPPQYDDLPPCGTNPGCVRVDVYRNMPDRYQTTTFRGNPLPTFFARLVGLADQGVRATATAQVTAGNQVRCLLPFAIADRWSDSTDELVATYANDGLHRATPPNPIGGWSPNDLFQDGTAAPGTDSYVPPYHPGHTGWTVYGDANRPGDYGRQLILKDGKVSQFSAGWAGLVDLPNSIGGCDVLTNIRGCNETPVAIAAEDTTCSSFANNTTTNEMAALGCIGIKAGGTGGPTKQGVEQNGGCDHVNDNIYAQDPGARWDPNYEGFAPNGMRGAVVNAAGQLNMDSARIRPVAVFHSTEYMQNASCRNQSGTACVAKVVNIIGFFVEGICETVRDRGELDTGMACTGGSESNKEIVGRIVTLPSSFATGAGSVSEESAFLTIIRLVR